MTHEESLKRLRAQARANTHKTHTIDMLIERACDELRFMRRNSAPKHIINSQLDHIADLWRERTLES